jgi:ABC-type branched-subunit amino acid transport system substrate-binding protein
MPAKHLRRLLPGVVLVPFMFADVVGAPAESFAWDDPLTPVERLGRTIYYQGRMDTGEELRVSLAGSDDSLSATLFRCVQCHGVWGQGTEEGGLRVPPLTPAFLTRPHASLQTGQHRGAYTDQTLIRAITQGVDVSGVPLHSGMPRYRFNEQQAGAVVSYLKKIGTEEDSDPGVTADTITVGAALPLSGTLAGIGQDAQSVMEGYFRGLNEHGGVYGRHIRLIVEDAGNNPAQLEAATTRLIKTGQVFALVGSFEFGEAASTLSLLERAQVPLVGPLALSPQPSDPPNPFVFYTLAGFDIQYRVLLDFLVSHVRSTMGVARPRVAVIQPKNTAILNAVLTPSQRKAMDIVMEHEYVRGSFDRVAVGEQLHKRSIDAVVFIGDGEDFLAIGQELDRRHLRPLLLASAGMVGHWAVAIPPSVIAKVFLASTLQPPTQQDHDHLQTFAGQHQLHNLGFARMAQGAAFLLGDVLMRMGRRVNRSLLVEELERFREVDTGAGFMITYGRQQRIGSSRARIFTITRYAPHFIPVTEWIAPGDRSSE